jgi:hypothetical protein
VAVHRLGSFGDTACGGRTTDHKIQFSQTATDKLIATTKSIPNNSHGSAPSIKYQCLKNKSKAQTPLTQPALAL